MKKVCINCGNLHNGGGVQVATSFIYELVYSLNINDLDISLNLSDEVRDNLASLNCDLKKFNNVSTLNIYGLSALKSNNRAYFSKFDIIFTVFGPDYLFFTNRAYRIVGFAQPWIIYPHNEVYQKLSLRAKNFKKLKFYLQRKFFSFSNYIIVEIDYVKTKLMTMQEFKKTPISIVHNSLGSIYSDKSMWESAPINMKKETDFSIGFLGRDYIHKNTEIIPLIKKELLLKHNKNVSFYVTFTEKEWDIKATSFKSNVYNIGALNVSQCPSFYENMDAIIFPSLLECFSATPLEAMAMEKPFFASDREFIRDVCSDYALYFDPEDPISAANVINDYLENSYGKDSFRLREAKHHALNFSSPKQRAEKYLEIIRIASN